ncbi:MAG: M48 family metallopeptidase [Elusimicrobia bacterium]|nr:M48 family metallopeptidase [Elusimicrobiota bacterium]
MKVILTRFKNMVILSFYLTAIPTVSYYISLNIQDTISEKARSAVMSYAQPGRASFLPNDIHQDISRLTVRRILSDPALGAHFTDQFRADAYPVLLMEFGAKFILFLGLGLLILVGLSGIVAKRHRTLLLYIFKPLLYFSIISVSLIAFGHGALAVSTIYYAETWYSSGVHVILILMIAGAGLLGTWAVMRGAFSAIKPPITKIVGTGVDRMSHPKIWTYVEDIANRIQALPPENIIVGFETNFFVSEASQQCLEGRLKGRTMFLSLPLCAILTPNELTAVIAHELGHFRGSDTKFSAKFYPIYRGLEVSLVNLAYVVIRRGKYGFVLKPAQLLLEYFFQVFAYAERGLGRERELLADRCAAELMGAETLGVVLVKIQAFSGLWGEIEKFIEKAVSDDRDPQNLCVSYSDVVIERKSISLIDKMPVVPFAHPTDTHPPLADRLKAQGLDLDQLKTKVLEVPHMEDSAMNLFGDYKSLEKTLGQASVAILHGKIIF